MSRTFVVLLAVEVFRRREGGCEGFLKELAAVLYREGIMRPGVGTHTVCYTCGYHIEDFKIVITTSDTIDSHKITTRNDSKHHNGHRVHLFSLSSWSL